MSFSYLTGEVENIGIAKIKKRAIGGVVAKCVFTAANNSDLASYPWTDPLDVRPGSNQWQYYNWVPVATTLRIDTNKVKLPDKGTVGVNVVDCAVANCAISLDATTGGAVGQNEELYIAFRATDVSNIWYAGIRRDTQQILITERTTGTITVRASAAKTIAINTTYNLALTLSGNSISLTMSGTTISYTSAVRNTVTAHGLLMYQSAGADGNARADNFVVTSL